MARLVQDEAGNIFYDEGGGVLSQVIEEQARVAGEALKSPVGDLGMVFTQELNNMSARMLSLG